ncbi:DnaB-like helicase C-terminal domain-containing protein [Thauera mechernichensis]
MSRLLPYPSSTEALTADQISDQSCLDLRDSGSIEQDADVIIFLYREGATKSEEQSAESEAELIVAKQRNGPIGSVKVLFKPETLSFRNTPRKEN